MVAAASTDRLTAAEHGSSWGYRIRAPSAASRSIRPIRNTSSLPSAGQLYNRGGERGVYESTDGGSTWTQMLAGDNDTTGAVDLAIDPSNPNRIFAAMWDHLREPDLRTYGGVGSGVYRSTDGGIHMATVDATGFPLPPPRLAGSESHWPLRTRSGFTPSLTRPTDCSKASINPTTAGTPGPSSPPTRRSREHSRPTVGGSDGSGSILSIRPMFSLPGSTSASQRTAVTSFTGEFSPHADHHAMAWDLEGARTASTSATTAAPTDRMSTARTTSGRLRLASRLLSSTAWM